MRVVFAGTPEPAVPALQALLESDRHEVVGVLTRPDTHAGRGRRVVRSPVGAVADAHGIEVLTPEKAGDREFLARLAQLAPAACPVVAYGGLLPQVALDIPRNGWINLHFSLLPAWRGAAPVQAAIKAGDEFTGASTFQIVQELDAGPVFGVTTDQIGPNDTAGSVLGRLAHAGADLLVSTLDGIEDGVVTACQQTDDGVSYAPKIAVSDARVSFDTPAFAVDRLVRAVTPEPGAWAEFRGERLKIGPVSVVEGPDLASGELYVKGKRVLVGTATVPVALGEVQGRGKRWMPATDWARGIRIEHGEGLT